MLDPTGGDITEGSLGRALVVLAAPLLVQNFVQVVQQVVDLFWLGRYSGDAVAAVGLVVPVLALLFALALMGPFVGTQVLVSQRVGDGDDPGARRAAFTGLAVALALGLGGGVALAALAGPSVGFLTATRPAAEAGRVTGMAIAYLSTIAVGLPLAAGSDAVEAAFVGRGDSRAALYVGVVTVATNLALDPLLIFGYGPVAAMGIRGAALATVSGYGAGLALALALAARGRAGGVYSRATAALDRAEVVELLDTGLPTAGQQAARQVVRLLVVGIVYAAGGAAGLAAYVVGSRVASVAFVPATGLQQAAQSVVGQNLGAEKLARAERATWLGVAIASGGLAVVGVAQWVAPESIAVLFVPELDGAAMALSVDYLRILAYGYPALGALYLFEAGFNGARRTRISLVASLVQYWGVRLPIAAVGVFVLNVGVHPVFWAVTVSNVLAAAGLGLYYRYATADGMYRRASEGASSAD